MNSRIVLALVAMLAPAALSAQSNQDLQKQIEQLKAQLKAVEETLRPGSYHFPRITRETTMGTIRVDRRLFLKSAGATAGAVAAAKADEWYPSSPAPTGRSSWP